MNNLKMEESALKDMVEKIVREIVSTNEEKAIPVEMSARHVHLTAEDVEVLFGSGATLTEKRPLTLPGFLAEERVTIVTPKGSFKNVAILGPVRNHTQVELSATDAFALGLKLPVNLSGDYTDAQDVTLVGPKGALVAKNSAIIAKAHIHLNQKEADELGLKDKQVVEVDVMGTRPISMKNVMIRVNEGMHAMMHIDMDEANACGYDSVKKAYIRKS